MTIKAPIVRTDVPNNRKCTLTFQAAIDTQGNTAADLPVTIKLNNLPHVFDPAVYSIPATIVIDTTATPGIVSIIYTFIECKRKVKHYQCFHSQCHKVSNLFKVKQSIKFS